MFSLRRTGESRTTSARAKERGHRRLSWRSAGDIVLIVAAGLAVIYVLSVAAQSLGTYTEVRPSPEYTMRLQVVDASGEPGRMAAALDAVRTVEDDRLAVTVVETKVFALHKVGSSYLISRSEDTQAAQILAERLGLDPGAVEYRPLDNNRRQVSATLVVGFDRISPVVAVPNQEEI